MTDEPVEVGRARRERLDRALEARRGCSSRTLAARAAIEAHDRARVEIRRAHLRRIEAARAMLEVHDTERVPLFEELMRREDEERAALEETQAARRAMLFRDPDGT